MKAKPWTPEEGLLKMASLCARSEQCPFDIQRKLAAKGLHEADVCRVTAELTECGFLSESRFARSLAHDKVAFSGWGRAKVSAALAAKRIPEDVIRDALASIDAGTYAESLRRAADSKSRSLDMAEYADRLKLYRFLVGRGYESSLASAEVRRLRDMNKE